MVNDLREANGFILLIGLILCTSPTCAVGGIFCDFARGGASRIKGLDDARCGELFAVQNEVLLYDVTSTYFEGEAEANPQAQRGYSRDHRPDCKQVCIALVVTFDGFPLGYEVFAGNTHDSPTLQTIVATMEARHGVLGYAVHQAPIAVDLSVLLANRVA